MSGRVATKGLVMVSKRHVRLAALYRSHSTMATRLAYLLTGDRERAEDICHDAFVRVAGRLGFLTSEDVFVSYLRRTVVNLSNSHFRRLRLERAHQLKEVVQETSVAYQADIETRDEILTLLRALPTRQKTAIVLRFYLELSAAETSEVMNASVDAVNGLVRRGLNQIEGGLKVPGEGIGRQT